MNNKRLITFPYKFHLWSSQEATVVLADCNCMKCRVSMALTIRPWVHYHWKCHWAVCCTLSKKLRSTSGTAVLKCRLSTGLVFLVSNLISAHQHSGFVTRLHTAGDNVLTLKWQGHTASWLSWQLQCACHENMAHIAPYFYHSQAVASGPRVQCQCMLHVICRLGFLDAVLASQSTA